MVSNRPRIFELRQALASLKQDESTVDAYFTKLKVIWDELSNYRPTCPSRLCGFNNEEHVMAFLMGLNESLAEIRDQILLMDPLPSMRKVFSLVVRQEKQMSITVSEEGDSEIHVPKKRLKVKNGRSHPYHLRSCKRLESNINSLPDDIVFDILVRIPAQDIYGAVKPVCRKWYQMICTHKFVNTHLHHSTYGLLIQKQVKLSTQLTFMSLSRQGQIELTRLNYEPEHNLWCSSCNGLILECESRNVLALYITNPVTVQRFSLPRPVYPSNGLGIRFSAMAYASLSMEYKVVLVHYTSGEKWGCTILTVGVDESWRPVCAQHLSLEAKVNLAFRPLTTEGFVHWAKSGNYLLTLNVETETITEYRVPSSSSGDRLFYFSTVKYLSMLIVRGECSWEVWEMKPKTGEWTQLPGIDLKDQVYEIFEGLRERGRIYKSTAFIRSRIFPVGWLEYREVLIYRFWCPQQLNIGIIWNIRLKEFEFVDLDSDSESLFVHRNSLLWLDGC
ncbi:hypothetical protein CASFOL_002412 [Castilleja foliolosa]|uniref:F-box domain-containing protein n=1 Tax=Castilleja foliolosa TaxID=1961234 RepID=A0ABD3EEF8_9LAMI